ncbi:Outer membrane efflux protein [Candidatus Magnetomoraceae bacterium gMMP-15]
MKIKSQPMVITVIFLSVVVICPRAFAGKSFISMSRYLNTAFQDDTLIFQNEKISFLKNSSSNTPFLNEIEFRMNIDEFESDKQKYAIRFKPNGWGEAKNGKYMYNKTLQYNKAMYDLLLNQALKDRYNIIIDYIYNRQMISLNEELTVLYEDRVNVLKQSADDLNFNPNDLIDAENDIIRLELDLINLKNETVNIEDEIRQNLPGTKAVNFDTARMISIQGMEKIIAATRLTEQKNVYLEYNRLNAALANARYELEKSENRKYLSFIETAYDTDDRDEFEKAFSIQFGISIPFINPNRLDTNLRKLSSLEAQSKYVMMQKKMTENSSILLRDVSRLIKQYSVLNAKKTQSKAKSFFDIYRRMEGANPLILLKLKESLLKTDISMQKITRRIYKKYINFMDISGKLSEKPLKNYLSDNLELIVP